MATRQDNSENSQQSNSSDASLNTFNKGMMMDIDDIVVPQGVWLKARNAVNNSDTGHLGVLGNEPSNTFCDSVANQFIVIGLIYISDGVWSVFSTNNIDSEIGIYREDDCSYRRIFRDLDGCLNFKTTHLIKGVSKEQFDCSRQLYWADGFNPDRTIGIKQDLNELLDEYFVNNKIYQQNGDEGEICEIDDYDKTRLNCDKTRIAQLVNPPCIELRRSNFSGSIGNGSYQVFIAYTINEQRVTDYIGISNVQPLYTHENINSSLEIVVSEVDERFDEFELVIVSFFNQQTVAKKLGIYSTGSGTITVDYINTELPSVPLSQIPIISTVYERSEAMYRNGDYLLRVAPTGYLDFNYQPRANRISAKWFASTEPQNYYTNGGNKTTYLRDEVYSFFIRWVYDTGYKSPSFHIPGRDKNSTDIITQGIDHAASTADITENSYELWQIKNTATKTVPFGPIDYNTSIDPNYTNVVAEGEMGYWESTEMYPNDKPEIWNTDDPDHPEWDLCGQRIRHHKFPDTDLIPHFIGDNTELTIRTHNNSSNRCATSRLSGPNQLAFSKGKNYRIVLLGVKFDNILPPVDLDGNLIPGIIGYEILRGTRENNRTIIAKGVITNLREYDYPEFTNNAQTEKKGLILNYPFNDLRHDELLSGIKVDGGCNSPCNFVDYPLLKVFNRRYVAFHSPDTNFGNPFLDVDEIKYTGELQGVAEGYFTEVNKHPKHALPNDGALIISMIFGFISALNYTVFSGFLSGTADYYTKIGDNATAMSGKPPIDDLPAGVDFLVSLIMKPIALIYYTIQIAQGYLDAMMALMSTRQYALQHKAHCFYSNIVRIRPVRQNVLRSGYIKDSRQGVDDIYTINNVYRTNFVFLNTDRDCIFPTLRDTSRYSIHKVLDYNNIRILDPTNKSVSVTSSCMYASLKVKIRNLYGQLNSIRQLLISPCLFNVSENQDANTLVPGTTYNVYGGDNYIGRYTEKNTFFFFYDWLMEQPDGIEFDYRKYTMIPYPRYWINTERYNTGQILEGLIPGLLCNDTDGESALDSINDDTYQGKFPSDNASLTRSACGKIKLSNIFCGNSKEDVLLRIDGWFYLFYSGVKDFFVESEINLSLRDYDEVPEKRFYDEFTYDNLDAMFDTTVVKKANYYKYDKSLSIAKYANVFPSWSTLHPRSYNPVVAAECYQSFPKRIIYSLPSSKEQKKDYWRNFLAFNYRDFNSTVTSISPISRNGSMIHFKDISPVQFIGVDTLQTDIGTKITIGDGGLFNQPLQNIVNTDAAYEYGSCQDRMSIINTPFGLFWISQDQGKIFQYGGQIKEISAKGMRWWFARYLKYELITAFPDFNILQNPVAGIGCQAIYDNKNQIIYFSKKDYKPLDPNIVYSPDANKFTITSLGLRDIKLTDKRYFEDASWTISYDPKTEAWISFHDWHPNFMIPERNTFTTIIGGSFWKHNNTCKDFCNFYGVDYPFEIETIVNSGQTVTTTRSVEYMMEAYRYADNCFDAHHLLDYNFDEMIVYNTEQISGILKLNLNSKNEPFINLTYPIVNPQGYIDVLYSKEENKYRVNQFFDVTLDRGEYSGNTNILWNTQANGYVKNINQASVNYNKDPFQHKKFRHYSNKVLFRKNVSNNIKMFFKIFNVKQQISMR